MLRLPRIVLLAVLLPAVLALSACGADKTGPRLMAESEGDFLDVGPLVYQVQLSRLLNPNDVEDRSYLRNVSDPSPGSADAWFGVWLRVKNPNKQPADAATTFVIEDTLGNEYRPVSMTAKDNDYVYTGDTVEPGETYPIANSPAFSSTIGGSVLIFKIPNGSFLNRPLEMKIEQLGFPTATVELDL